MVAQNFDKATPSGSGPIGLNSLDCFGRTQSIDYRAGTITGTAMLKLTYAYDQAGSRLQENRYPQPGGGSGTNREQLNQYDEFGRLSESDIDNVASGGTHTNYFANQWSLDALGNWLELQTTLGANNATQNREHDYLNQIDNITSALPTVTPVYDEAGNLRYDGQFVYQYDAWNRLCQVTLPNQTGPPGTPGILVKHFLYDGLGRLIRVQSPYPDPQTGASNNEVRSERIFYDGVRRIQELVTDPLPDTSFAAQQGNQEAQGTIADQPTANLNITSSRTETSLLRGGPGGGGGLPPGMSLEREYIWGPGDRGLDELLAQFGPTRAPSYPLHDGGGDIVALADKNGAGSTPRLVWQATYDAYGQVIEEHTLHAHSYLHAGHKGLFFDRLDSSILDPVTFNEIPRLMPAGHAGSTGSARIIGYARNRHLHTGFGRWLQRDPNATGAVVLESMPFHGGALGVTQLSGFSINGLYGDGPNMYGTLGLDPWTRGDPNGLFSTAWMAWMAPGAAWGILANGLGGALLGGAMDAMMGGDFFGSGMIAGGLGGAYGTYAFAASRAGLLATMAAKSAQTQALLYGGATGGFVAGSVGSALNGKSPAEALADGAFAAMLGGAFGIASGKVSSFLNGGDDAILAPLANITTGQTLMDQLTACAAAARATVGAGKGGGWGTKVHSEFERFVKMLGNPNLKTEQSYLNGNRTSRGRPGSVRIDVVEGNPDAPTALYDLKNNSATLTPARKQEIWRHVPGGSSVPIYEVR